MPTARRGRIAKVRRVYRNSGRSWTVESAPWRRTLSGKFWINFTTEAQRGKGMGTQLLRHIESLVFARTKNLFACVSDFNKGARDFYKKQGYQEIGPMPNFLIPGTAEILLRKTMGPTRNS